MCLPIVAVAPSLLKAFRKNDCKLGKTQLLKFHPRANFYNLFYAISKRSGLQQNIYECGVRGVAVIDPGSPENY